MLVTVSSGENQNPDKTNIYWMLVAALAPCVALALRSGLDSTDSIPGIVPPTSM